MVERLTKRNQRFLLKNKTCKRFKNFNGTSVDSLCSKLKDLIREPLTKQDLRELVHGLDSRKQVVIEHRKSIGNTSNVYDLKYINLNLYSGVIIEQGNDKPWNKFTFLLENLTKEKPEFFAMGGKNHAQLATRINKLHDFLVEEINKE